LGQVDQPPADHPVDRRERTALDDPVQRLPLLDPPPPKWSTLSYG
jgi:hypothetical protein